MTIINRDHLTAAVQPTTQGRCVLTLIIDASYKALGLAFPIVTMPFVSTELPQAIKNQRVITNAYYCLDEAPNTFLAIEKLLVELGLANNVTLVKAIGGNHNETFYQVLLNIEPTLLALAA
jgi:hypothetical protein